MSTSTSTADEMSNSLTGYDEIAITKHMGFDIYLDAETKPVASVRALVFVDQRRNGLTDVEALAYALTMPLVDVMAYFADPEPELDPDNPETESGKEDSEPE